MIKKLKTKARAAKCQKTRKKMSLSDKKIEIMRIILEMKQI